MLFVYHNWHGSNFKDDHNQVKGFFRRIEDDGGGDICWIKQEVSYQMVFLPAETRKAG